MLAPQPVNRLLRFGVLPMTEGTPFATASGGLAEPATGGKWTLVRVSLPCPDGRVICDEHWSVSWRWVAKAARP